MNRTSGVRIGIAFAAVLVLGGPAARASAVNAPAQVYFVNESGPSGLVDVFVDGQPVFEDMFAFSPSMFARPVAAGAHQVVITPAGQTPAQHTLLRKTVELNAGATYTFRLAQGSDDFNTPVLSLDVGTGDTTADP